MGACRTGCPARRIEPRPSASRLENLGQFRCESAFRFRLSAPVITPVATAGRPVVRLLTRTRTLTLTLGSRRLGGVGSQQTAFERRSIEPADDGLHLFLVRRFDESEALGFLRLGVADYLDRIGNHCLGVEPRLDVIGCHPDRQVAQKNGKSHARVFITPLVGMVGEQSVGVRPLSS